MRWKPKDCTKWSLWFAWYPVTLLNGEKRFLEFVCRRYVDIGRMTFDYIWQYTDPRPSKESQAIAALFDRRDGLPLLKMIVNDEIEWMSAHYSASSTSGRLVVENDIYFYLRIYKGVSSYSISNLVDREMATMLECAAINKSRIGNAVDDYTEFLNGRN